MACLKGLSCVSVVLFRLGHNTGATPYMCLMVRGLPPLQQCRIARLDESPRDDGHDVASCAEWRQLVDVMICFNRQCCGELDTLDKFNHDQTQSLRRFLRLWHTTSTYKHTHTMCGLLRQPLLLSNGPPVNSYGNPCEQFAKWRDSNIASCVDCAMLRSAMIYPKVRACLQLDI